MPVFGSHRKSKKPDAFRLGVIASAVAEAERLLESNALNDWPREGVAKMGNRKLALEKPCKMGGCIVLLPAVLSDDKPDVQKKYHLKLDSKERPTPKRARNGHLRNCRILMIDSDGFACDVVRSLLEPIGVTIDSAKEGSDGILKLNHKQFHGVVIDLNLPGMNGLDVAVKIRELYPRIPLALLCADQQYLEAVTMSDFKFDVMMRKPIRAIELYEAIDKLVGDRCIRQAS